MDERARGNFGYPPGTPRIWCFARAANLGQELADLGEAIPLEERTKSVVQRGRDCPNFYRYSEGLDPRGHADELKMLELERHRQQFEETMEQRRREWEQELEKERRKFDRFLGLVLAILALAAILVTMASVPNDSWLVCRLHIGECASGQESEQPVPEQEGVLPLVVPEGNLVEVGRHYASADCA